MEITHCPVCGHGPFDTPYSSVLECSRSYDICDCCGCEYGYDDSYISLDEWIAAGARWAYEAPPDGWNLESQLEHAIEGWCPAGRGYATSETHQAKYASRIEEFFAWATDPSPKRRLSAVFILGWLEDERIDSVLESLSNDIDEDIRLLAKRALEGRALYRAQGFRKN